MSYTEIPKKAIISVLLCNCRGAFRCEEDGDGSDDDDDRDDAMIRSSLL